MRIKRRKQNVFYLLLFIISVVVLSSTGCELEEITNGNGIVETDDYMGLVLGATWTYAVETHYCSENGDEILEGIVEIRVIDIDYQKDGSTIIRRAYFQDDDDQMYPLLQRFLGLRQDHHLLMSRGDDDYWGEIIRKREDSYELIGEFYHNGEYREFLFDEPIIILQSPLKEGDMYTSLLWWFEMTVDTMERVTVPYGTFNSWLMIDDTIIDEDEIFISTLIDVWFYPYIGEIKNYMEMFVSKDASVETMTFTMELIDFTY